MDANKLDVYFVSNSKYFPTEKIALIRDKMAQADDSRYAMISSVELKDPTTMLLISIFLGELGVDQFMLGNTGKGILKLLTLGLCGILWIMDVCTISKNTKELNYNKIMQVL